MVPGERTASLAGPTGHDRGLRELVKIARLAPTLTDAQLRARLVTLAEWLR